MWYFAKDGRAVGPVEEAALGDLARRGEIGPRTLVWREGMPAWAAVAEACPSALPKSGESSEAATCAQCGRLVPRDNTVPLAGQPVCAECKPEALQRLKEGVAIASETTAWRVGRQGMAINGSELPPRCLKCNGPATGPPIRCRFYWHHPALYLLILFCAAFYVVIAIVARRRGTLQVHLCEVHRRRHWWLLGMAWGIGLAAGWALYRGFWATSMVLFSGGLLLLLVAGVMGAVVVPLVRPTHIEGRMIRFRGAGRSFLESLPEGPA